MEVSMVAPMYKGMEWVCKVTDPDGVSGVGKGATSIAAREYAVLDLEIQRDEKARDRRELEEANKP